MPTTDYDPDRDRDRDLFAVLGAVWDADADTLRRAWRAASRASHPDTGGTHEAFLEVQYAWEVLSDPIARTRYVRAREARHGRQRGRARPGASHDPPGSARRATGGGRRRSTHSVRCSGTTREGLPCRNPATRGSERCWVHGGSPAGSTDPRRPRAGPPPPVPPPPSAGGRPEREDCGPVVSHPTGAARHRVRGPVHSGVAVLALIVVVGIGVGFVRWQSRPVTVGFDEAIKASSAECASTEALNRAAVLGGFKMTCTMTDASPGNRDRPYAQLRLDGCEDWQRLDHDDGAEPVALTVELAPCGSVPSDLRWQVCQTHGGLLPDDCDDGREDLPTG